MNVVLCSGVMRSGSTWTYNALRALLGTTADFLGLPFYCSYLEGEGLDEFLHSDKALYPGVGVFKAHSINTKTMLLIDSRRIKNVCSVRDPRDCVALRQLFKSDESLTDSIRLVRGSFATAMGLSRETTLFLDYKEILKRPDICIDHMLEYLQLQFGQLDELKEAIIDELSMDKMVNDTEDDYDELTQVHKNHTHGGKIGRYREELTKEDLELIEEELGDQIKWYGDLFK